MESNQQIRVFKFYYDEYHTTVSSKTEQEALDELIEFEGDVEVNKMEEIFECDWDKKFIDCYPDNDRSRRPFKLSIRECLEGNTPTIIFSNNLDF